MVGQKLLAKYPHEYSFGRWTIDFHLKCSRKHKENNIEKKAKNTIMYGVCVCVHRQLALHYGCYVLGVVQCRQYEQRVYLVDLKTGNCTVAVLQSVIIFSCNLPKPYYYYRCRSRTSLNSVQSLEFSRSRMVGLVHKRSKLTYQGKVCASSEISLRKLCNQCLAIGWVLEETEDLAQLYMTCI